MPLELKIKFEQIESGELDIKCDGFSGWTTGRERQALEAFLRGGLEACKNLEGACVISETPIKTRTFPGNNPRNG